MHRAAGYAHRAPAGARIGTAPFALGDSAARRRPKRVKLIDWSRRARRHHEWLWSDGTHLRAAGVQAHTRILKRVAWSRQRGRFG